MDQVEFFNNIAEKWDSQITVNKDKIYKLLSQVSISKANSILDVGTIFLPMHLPVILSGFLIGPVCGALIGFITPIICGLLTGMPPLMPTMPIMALELCGYGFAAGLLFTKTNKIFVSLLGTMIFGRICAMLGAFILSITFAPAVTPVPYIIAAVTNGIPGIIIQIVLIPVVVKFLVSNKETAKLLEVK